MLIGVITPPLVLPRSFCAGTSAILAYGSLPVTSELKFMGSPDQSTFRTSWFWASKVRSNLAGDGGQAAVSPKGESLIMGSGIVLGGGFGV
jgi:hypothetical protein